MPSPSELVFLLVMLLILIGGRHALFNDPGTLWHLRLGRDILSTGTVPRLDTLTYTHGGEPWVDQSWAFDAGLALVVDYAGWPVAIALAVILLASVYAALTKGLIGDGFAPIIAVYVALTAVAIGCIHFLIRPHLITLAFVYLSLKLCQKQHERGGWIVAWVPVLTALLANLHGGFLALPGIVATATVAHAVSGRWDNARKREVVRFGLAFVACCLAGLINPYGFGLYRHVGNLLVTSGVTTLIEEYQPAPFGKAETRVLEMTVLALMALPAVVSSRTDRYQLVHLLVWLHLALSSVRNAPLFAFAAAGPLATLLEGLPITFRDFWSDHKSRIAWIPAFSVGLLCMALAGVSLGGFKPGKWPFPALATLNRQPTSSHLFHEQDWGGLISSECSPPRPSFVDDRFELFGKEAILEYAEALAGGPAWVTIRDRDQIGLVWVRPERGLAKRMAEEHQWKELYRDKVSVLYGRDVPPPLVTSSRPSIRPRAFPERL
jgi:hypothetical protein